MGERLAETCSYSGSPPPAKGRRRTLHHYTDESEAGMTGWTRHTLYTAPSLVVTRAFNTEGFSLENLLQKLRLDEPHLGQKGGAQPI